MPSRPVYEPAPRLSWDLFFDWFSETWKINDRDVGAEHVTVIGPSGSGKSTLTKELLRIPERQLVVFTKPRDPIVAKYLRSGYTAISRWPRNPPDDVNRFLLWARGPKSQSASGPSLAEKRAHQREIVGDALHRIFNGPRGGEPGGVAVSLDETRYVADMKFLGLGPQIIEGLIQGRTIDMPHILGFQRPSWVPPEAYDQASYLFIAADNDKRNVQRFREIGGADGDELAATVTRLGPYEFAFVDARPGYGGIAVVKVEKKRSAKPSRTAGTVRV